MLNIIPCFTKNACKMYSSDQPVICVTDTTRITEHNLTKTAASASWLGGEWLLSITLEGKIQQRPRSFLFVGI